MATLDSSGENAALPARIGGPRGITYLMYHEIDVAGRSLSRDFSGHVAYAVPEAEFRSQLQYLREHSWRGISVSEALSTNASNAQMDVVITFDDGSETDLLAAAPLLEEINFKATFYVIVGWLGRSGYLSESQVRALHAPRLRDRVPLHEPQLSHCPQRHRTLYRDS